MGVLSFITFLPLVMGLLILAVPNSRVWTIAKWFSWILFGIGIWFYWQTYKFGQNLHYVEKLLLVESFRIQWALGVDAVSGAFVALTLLLGPFVVYVSQDSVDRHAKGFLSLLFISLTPIIGSFVALDGVLFFLFWEFSLIPMYFLIGVWGSEGRHLAAWKFVIYTFSGSVLFLVGIIALMILSRQQLGYYSALITDWYQLELPFVAGQWFHWGNLLFWAFVLAFAIKTPIFPFHTWLPEAHVQAPTAASVILAAVMLKMGTYGFLRFVVPLFDQASAYWSWLLVGLGVVGIIYGAVVAFSQSDMKKVVAYSSVSHMGYVVAGTFSLNESGLLGAWYQMWNHGVVTGGLFLMVGMLYSRLHSRDLTQIGGGLAKHLPKAAVIFFILSAASMAVPMTNGFVSEFLSLLGIFRYSYYWGALALLGVVLGATYMLWLYLRLFWGRSKQDSISDLDWPEVALMLPIIFVIFVGGIKPQVFLNPVSSSIKLLVNDRSNYQLNCPSCQEH